MPIQNHRPRTLKRRVTRDRLDEAIDGDPDEPPHTSIRRRAHTPRVCFRTGLLLQGPTPSPLHPQPPRAMPERRWHPRSSYAELILQSACATVACLLTPQALPQCKQVRAGLLRVVPHEGVVQIAWRLSQPLHEPRVSPERNGPPSRPKPLCVDFERGMGLPPVRRRANLSMATIAAFLYVQRMAAQPRAALTFFSISARVPERRSSAAAAG